MSERIKKRADLAIGALICVLVLAVTAGIDITSALALSSDPIERAILVGVASLTVLWKAVGLTKVVSLWREGRRWASIMPAILLVVAVAISSAMEASFYQRLFVEQADSRGVVSKEREHLKAELSKLTAEIERSSTATVGEIEVAIQSVFTQTLGSGTQAKTVGAVTAFCTKDTNLAPGPCGRAAALSQDLATAKAIDSKRARVDELMKQLKDTPVVVGGHALADKISQATGRTWKTDDVLLALAVLIMVLIQLGSATLPYVYFGGPSVGTSSVGRGPTDNGQTLAASDREAATAALHEPEIEPAIATVAGPRLIADASDDRMPKKIRNHTMDKVPFLLIAGEDDRAAGAVSFRYRDGSQKNGVAIDDAIEEIVTAIDTRAHA